MDVVSRKTVSITVNGESYEREVDARRLLIHFLRDDLDLTGSHVGCDTGNCGAGPGLGPTAKVNAPRTGWPSTEMTRQ